MAIVLMIEVPDWLTADELRATLRDRLPGTDIRCWPELGRAGEVDMLVVDRLVPGVLDRLPNLRLIQKLGAGVDSIVRDPELLNQAPDFSCRSIPPGWPWGYLFHGFDAKGTRYCHEKGVG